MYQIILATDNRFFGNEKKKNAENRIDYICEKWLKSDLWDQFKKIVSFHFVFLKPD